MVARRHTIELNLSRQVSSFRFIDFYKMKRLDDARQDQDFVCSYTGGAVRSYLEIYYGEVSVLAVCKKCFKKSLKTMVFPSSMRVLADHPVKLVDTRV